MSPLKRGFTLIELIVVIAIISLLSSIVFSSLSSARMKSREARRLLDMRQILNALELYYNSHGNYPYPSDGDCGGYDSASNGSFIDPLVIDGLLPVNFRDPLKPGGSCYNDYLYVHYTQASGIAQGCGGAFFQLLFKSELYPAPAIPPTSPGYLCGGSLWQNPGIWLTGLND